jgi:hypothetical protein
LLKTLFLILVSSLFAVNARAQTGVPQELTCTERAFNLSFSLGSKWKLTSPKMGPVESREYVPGNNMLWRTPSIPESRPSLFKIPGFLTSKSKLNFLVDSAGWTPKAVKGIFRPSN